MKFQKAFIELLKTPPAQLNYDSKAFKVIEEFVCRMYTLNTNNVNEGRFELFEKKYKSKKPNEKLTKKHLKGYDASSLPPTRQTLLQQIKRTIYISSIWCNAHLRTPTELHPHDCGWTIIDDSYEFYWYDGPESPTIEQLYTGTYF